jgi:hypothetical protein
MPRCWYRWCRCWVRRSGDQILWLYCGGGLGRFLWYPGRGSRLTLRLCCCNGPKWLLRFPCRYSRLVGLAIKHPFRCGLLLWERRPHDGGAAGEGCILPCDQWDNAAGAALPANDLGLLSLGFQHQILPTTSTMADDDLAVGLDCTVPGIQNVGGPITVLPRNDWSMGQGPLSGHYLREQPIKSCRGLHPCDDKAGQYRCHITNDCCIICQRQDSIRTVAAHIYVALNGIPFMYL